MPSQISIMARVRKILEGIDQSSPDQAVQVTVNDQLELIVASGASPQGEITRVGRAFKNGTQTAVAGVVAIPTTAVGFAIYNNEPDGGRSYIIDRVWAQNVASTAVATQAQMLALVGQVRETAPTDATPANSLVKLNGFGGGSTDSRQRAILTATALPATTGLQGLWIPVGPAGVKTGVAALPGYGMEALIQGRMICAPGRYFAITVLSSVVGETFQMGVEWHEKLLRLG
jgi:hypothetical protein